jgi:lysylphosphatidylglycerol synthetase-like protein (DUF2156 family)
MVTGIIFIVLALYNIFSSGISLRYNMLFFIDPILSIIIGILGIKYCNNIEKAKLLMCFAIIVLVFRMLLFIIRNGGYRIYWITLIQFIPSICFLIGAKMNLKIKEGK